MEHTSFSVANTVRTDERTKLSRIYFLDSILILINLSLSGSLLTPLFFFKSHGNNVAFVALLNLAYLFIRFRLLIKLPSHSLFILYFILNLINGFTTVWTNTGNYYPFAYLLTYTTFYIILYNCYIHYRNYFDCKRSIKMISRGYLWLSVWSVISVLLLFFLIKMGVSPTHNDVSNVASILDDNVNRLGHTYYFPYYTSLFLVQSASRVFSVSIPFFADYGGVICGLFFEPHILTFFIFPTLFVFLGYATSLKKKIFLFAIWIFVLLITHSVTNIVAFLACFSVLLLTNKKQRFIGGVLLLFVVFVFTYPSASIDNTSFSFLQEKISGDNAGSKEVSEKLLQFAFSPKTLFGTNFLNNGYVHGGIAAQNMDIGYIPFVLNLIFLVILVYKIVYILVIGTSFQRYLGLAVLYFLLHSSKTAMYTYSQSLLIFMIFLVYLASQKNLWLIEKDKL